MGPPPYYREEPGKNPPSEPASRPHSPTASKPASRTSSAPRLPLAVATSSAPLLPSAVETSSAPSTTSRLTSAVATSSAKSPRSRSSTTKTKSVEELLKIFVHQTDKDLKGYEFKRRVDYIKEELYDIKRTAHYIRRYDIEKKNTSRYLPPPSFNDNKGSQYNSSTIREHRRYLYDKTEFYKELYKMLNDQGHSYLDPNNSTQNSKKGGGRVP